MSSNQWLLRKYVVLKNFSVLRCKEIPQSRSPTDAAVMNVLLIEAHADSVSMDVSYHSSRSSRRRKSTDS